MYIITVNCEAKSPQALTGYFELYGIVIMNSEKKINEAFHTYAVKNFTPVKG